MQALEVSHIEVRMPWSGGSVHASSTTCVRGWNVHAVVQGPASAGKASKHDQAHS